MVHSLGVGGEGGSDSIVIKILFLAASRRRIVLNFVLNWWLIHAVSLPS